MPRYRAAKVTDVCFIESLELSEMKAIEVVEPQTDFSEFYSKHGYVALREIIPMSALTKLQEQLVSLLDTKDWGGIGGTTFDEKLIRMDRESPEALHRFQIAASRLSSLSTIAGCVSGVVEQLVAPSGFNFLSGMGFVLGIPGSSRLSYGWHQDGTYQEDEDQVTIHVWFPVFSAATHRNGAMSMLDSSHNLGVLDFEYAKPGSNGYTTNQVVGIEDLVRRYEEVACELALQDCLFFCDEVIHRSNDNTTDRCRVAGVFKFWVKPSFERHPGLVGV